MKYKKTVIVSVILFTVALLASAWLLFLSFAAAEFGMRLPPENHTSTYMYPLKTRILRFAKMNNRLPSTLSELPPLDGFINRTTDIWGNEIKYTVDGTT